MAVEWSTSAPELLLGLDRTASVPLRAQPEGLLRGAVRSGRLAAGERLPSSRSHAAYLGLSRGVVQDCYEQLAAEGYLLSRGGSATGPPCRGSSSSASATPECAPSQTASPQSRRY